MTEREIAEVLRDAWANDVSPSDTPNFRTMARAVVGLKLNHLANHGTCKWEAGEHCDYPHDACRLYDSHAAQLADRDARLARLVEALTSADKTVSVLHDLLWSRDSTQPNRAYDAAKANELIWRLHDTARAALADAGAGKERGDGV